MKVFIKYFLVTLVVLSSGNLYAATIVPVNRCQDPNYVQYLKTLWMTRKPAIVTLINGSSITPYNLYNVQIETNNLLTYAGACNDDYILNNLLSTYLLAIKTLDTSSNYNYLYFPDNGKRQTTGKLANKYRMWLDGSNNEDVLASAQFMFLITNALDIISSIEASKRTTGMNDFVKAFAPVVLEHYQRWILDSTGPFQVRGWGCRFNGKYVATGLNHNVFITKLLSRELGDFQSPKYCNAVTDTELLIIGGVANFWAAQKKAPTIISVPADKQTALLNYVKLGAKLIQSRSTIKQIYNFDGTLVPGLNFDLGIWDDYQDYAYAGYTMTGYPKQKIPAITNKKNIGWDLSHARRFVNVFQSLYANQGLLGLSFPALSDMQGVANQFIYTTYNRSPDVPLFTNFLDGSNGWFRVGYSDRVGYGYAPNDQSIAVLEGGYGFLSQYNSDIGFLFCKLELMINSKVAKVRKHVIDHYESVYQNNFQKVRSADFTTLKNSATQASFLQFFPTLYQATNSCS